MTVMYAMPISASSRNHHFRRWPAMCFRLINLQPLENYNMVGQIPIGAFFLFTEEGKLFAQSGGQAF